MSDRNWKSMQADGISPLDEAQLFVARFNDDGTGDWLELPGNGDPESTNFPIAGSGGSAIPRDATFVITRKDGGIVGS